MTPQVTQTALQMLNDSGDQLQRWLAENRDITCDRSLLGSVLTEWLEQKIEALCEDAAEIIQREDYSSFYRLLEKAERVEIQAKVAEERADYWHLAA